jgi:hypothetical protein
MCSVPLRLHLDFSMAKSEDEILTTDMIRFLFGGHLPKTSEVLIGLPDGDHVLLRDWRRASEEWTLGEAEVRCGPWQGRVRVEFYSNELERFAEEIRKLYRELSGQAILHPIETYITITLTGDGRGGIKVDGYALSDFVTDTRLCFQFTIDQTFLPRIADELCAVKP